MITAIVNQKGGTGKTTTAINLGKGLSKCGRKVLLIDLDAQGNLSYSLSVNDFNQSMSDVLMGDVSLKDIIVTREEMDVAPSEVSLSDVELSISNFENRASVLKEVLGDISGYDNILIDCPPSLSLLTVNALNAAENVLIPMQLEVLSLQGLDQISQTIDKIRKAYNRNLKIMGILPVMVDKRRKLSAEIYDHINENYDFRIFDSSIRTNVRASEAPSFGQSVISYDPRSNSALDYMALANEVLMLNDN